VLADAEFHEPDSSVHCPSVPGNSWFERIAVPLITNVKLAGLGSTLTVGNFPHDAAHAENTYGVAEVTGTICCHTTLFDVVNPSTIIIFPVPVV
jgi:hypothetical protein